MKSRSERGRAREEEKKKKGRDNRYIKRRKLKTRNVQEYGQERKGYLEKIERREESVGKVFDSFAHLLKREKSE